MLDVYTDILALRFQYNAIFKVVTPDSHQGWLPVLRHDGTTASVPWLGFIDLEAVRRWPGRRKPVKLMIREYSVSVGAREDWFPVPQGRYVQGCLDGGGVYAVMYHGRPRLVPVPENEKGHPGDDRDGT